MQKILYSAMKCFLIADWLWKEASAFKLFSYRFFAKLDYEKNGDG